MIKEVESVQHNLLGFGSQKGVGDSSSCGGGGNGKQTQSLRLGGKTRKSLEIGFADGSRINFQKKKKTRRRQKGWDLRSKDGTDSKQSRTPKKKVRSPAERKGRILRATGFGKEENMPSSGEKRKRKSPENKKGDDKRVVITGLADR